MVSVDIFFISSVGEESDTGTLEAGAAFLFETFKDVEMVTHNTTVKLKSMFGPFPASAASKACDVVHRLSPSFRFNIGIEF